MSDPDGETGQQPSDANAHYNRGITLAEQGKLDEAIAEFRAAIRLQPDFLPAYACLTAALRRKGEFAEALSELREVRDFGKAEVEEAWRVHAAFDTFGFTQVIERDIAELEPLAELEKKLSSVLSGQVRAASVAETLAFAQLCSEKRLHATSARFWAEAFQSDRTLADADGGRHRRHAACEAVLAGSGQGKADPPLDRAAQAGLRRQALDWIKADLAAWDAFVDGDDPEALEEAAWALPVWKMDSALDGVRDPDALARLPEAERKAWQAVWADLTALLIRLHRAEIRLNPDDPALHFQLGNALRERGELDEAIAAYRAAIRLQPGVVPRNRLGIALADQGKLEDAIAEFRAAIRLDPHDPRSHHNLGKALARRGTRDEAIVEYRAAIQLDPCDAESHNDLAGALREQGSLAEAVDEYRTAIRLEPDNAAGYYNLGLALRAKGELAEAIAAFREARDQTQPGSDLALLIEQALAESNQ